MLIHRVFGLILTFPCLYIKLWRYSSVAEWRRQKPKFWFLFCYKIRDQILPPQMENRSGPWASFLAFLFHSQRGKLSTQRRPCPS